MSDEQTKEQLLQRYKARERFWSVIAAWGNGHISEMQACKLCGLSAVELREVQIEQNQVSSALWDRYRETGETIDDDIRREAGTSQMERTRLGSD